MVEALSARWEELTIRFIIFLTTATAISIILGEAFTVLNTGLFFMVASFLP